MMKAKVTGYPKLNKIDKAYVVSVDSDGYQKRLAAVAQQKKISAHAERLDNLEATMSGRLDRLEGILVNLAEAVSSLTSSGAMT